MDRYRAEMKKFYFDPSKHKTYLDQLGIKYPTVRTAATNQPEPGRRPARAGRVWACRSGRGGRTLRARHAPTRRARQGAIEQGAAGQGAGGQDARGRGAGGLGAARVITWRALPSLGA